MKCPKCDSKLSRIKYQGANIRQCPNCNGMLLDSNRAEKIEKRVNKDLESLVKESESSASEDIAEKIRCPSCRDHMEKDLIEELDFHVDECGNCDKAWFDGGELARLQLAFESDPQREELNRMRQRIQNMTDAERAEYEARIADLKDLGSPMAQAISGANGEFACRLWWSR